MSALTIRKAYCVELGRVVNIAEARREFLNMATLVPRFTFLCQSKACADHRVVVIGVSYRVLAKDAPKHVTAHFRKHNEHCAGCDWIGPPKDKAGEVDGALQEKPESNRSRSARLKLTDFVTVFDPRPSFQVQAKSPSLGAQLPESSCQETSKLKPVSRNVGVPSQTRTSDFSLLVETYREAREVLSRNEFSALELKVVGIGRLLLEEYFVRMQNATTLLRNRVIFGGARLLKRYGSSGFKFQFIDQVNGGVVTLYVAPETVIQHPLRRYWESLIREVPRRRYVTIYSTGYLGRNDERGTMELLIPDLDHVEIILGPEKIDA